MGNFSRDTFQLTNMLYQLLTGESVVDSRHYVGVRVQQGVPLVDADLLELEDIRRFDLQAHLKHFFGNGVPSENTGFQIGPVTEDNNFTINPGIALVGGMLVINPNVDLTYSDQETLFGVTLDALAPPVAGVRDDLVYLDVWEEEIAASDMDRADGRLINPLIGIETSRRIERRWVVRLAPDTSDLGDVTQEVGHDYLALARIRRVQGQDRIQAGRIDDLRRTDLNVAKYLKIPVHVERGLIEVNSQRLEELWEGLRRIFFERLEDDLLFVDSVTDPERTIVYFSVQQITQACSTAAMLARTKNLTKEDALEAFLALYAAQEEFLSALSEHGNGDAPATAFIDQYNIFLSGGPGVDGIQNPMAEGDLIGAYLGQQELNAWLSAEAGTLPEGDVLVQYLMVDPPGDIVATQEYDITVGFTSDVSSDQTNEIFDVTVLLSSDLWSADPLSGEITLDNEGGTGQLVFTVTPNAGNAQCDFQVIARARRNPTIQSPPNILQLEIGQTPVIAAILQYAGPSLNLDGRLEMNPVLLNAGLAGVEFAVNNFTDTSHTYTLRFLLSIDGGDSSAPQDSISGVAAFDTETVILNFGAPSGTTMVAGDTGTLHVTLIQIDGTDLDSEDQETVDVDFITI